MPVDLPKPRDVHSLGSGIEKLRHKWGWIVALGIALDLAGLVALGSVAMASVASVLVIGVMMLLSGASELAMGFRAKDWTHFLFWVLGGLLYIAAGLFAIVNPILALTILTLLLGAGLAAAGIVRLVLAFQLPASRPRLLVGLTGLLTALLGLVIVVHWPVNSLFVLGLMLALDLMFHGIGWILFGLTLRRLHR